MKRYKKPLKIFLMLSLILFSCNKVTNTDFSSNDYIYFNSFESASDTSGWSGNGGLSLRKDTPPEAGIQSLYVVGGCIIPHVQLEVDKQQEDGHYTLQGWIKILQLGGVVRLHIADSSKSISISSADTLWNFYQSEDTLYCPVNLNMTLEFMSGGLIPGGMLVDQIAIKQIR